MNLRGWDYTGRNVGPEFHKQYKLLVDCLLDNTLVDNLTWSSLLQKRIAPLIGASSPGAVRTIKKMCDNFGFFLPFSLTSKKSIDSNILLSQRGKIVYQAATLEIQVNDDNNVPKETKEQIFLHIKNLYEEAYCDALIDYHFINADGTLFYPLKATLKALKKYGKMDKWEWYLLNTFVRHNDNEQEEKLFDKHILKYRQGDYSFTMNNVIEKPKGHQYIPQYFEFAGLVDVTLGANWCISNSIKHLNIKEEVLSMNYVV